MQLKKDLDCVSSKKLLKKVDKYGIVK